MARGVALLPHPHKSFIRKSAQFGFVALESVFALRHKAFRAEPLLLIRIISGAVVQRRLVGLVILIGWAAGLLTAVALLPLGADVQRWFFHSNFVVLRFAVDSVQSCLDGVEFRRGHDVLVERWKNFANLFLNVLHAVGRRRVC
jgi:hypothetical protein